MRKAFKKHRVLSVILVVVAIIAIVSTLGWLITVTPANSATVTITPTSKRVTKNYELTAAANPDISAFQIQAHMLSASKTATKTVVIDKVMQNATNATGQVTFTPVSGGTEYAGPYTVTSNSGVDISFTLTQDISSGSVTVFAQATKPGARGNIAAYDLDSSWQEVDNPGVVFHVVNTQAFTGGQDQGLVEGYVAQSDIDDSAATLTYPLTVDVQAKVQSQTLTNETFIDTTLTCKTAISANHKVGDQAPSVTTKVTVTCTALAIDKAAAEAMAKKMYQQDSFFQPANAFIGKITVVLPLTWMHIVNAKTFTTPFTVTGERVFQFSDAQCQQMALLIAGKPTDDAIVILQKQQGVKLVSITTEGFWKAMPTELKNIKFAIQSVA